MMAGQGYWKTKDGDVRIWFLGGTKGQSTDFANLRIRLLGRKRKEREVTETKVGTSRQVL